MIKSLLAAGALTASLALPVAPVSASAPSLHMVYDNGFNTAYPSSAFTGCTHDGCPHAPYAYLGAEPAGNRDDSGHCVYNAAKVASVHDGYLDMYAHTSNGTCYSVNFHPTAAPMTYGQYEVHFKADNVQGYHFVVLLWPTVPTATAGEIDGPEANLGNPWHGFVHQGAGTGPFDIYVQQSNPAGWHYWTVTWLPSGIHMYLDGRNVPIQGSEPVPHTPMYVAFHVESWMGTSVRPAATSAGHVDIDWLRIWDYK